MFPKELSSNSRVPSSVIFARINVTCKLPFFNNAGTELGGLLTNVTEAEYRRVFDINVWVLR